MSGNTQQRTRWVPPLAVVNVQCQSSEAIKFTFKDHSSIGIVVISSRYTAYKIGLASLHYFVWLAPVWLKQSGEDVELAISFPGRFTNILAKKVLISDSYPEAVGRIQRGTDGTLSQVITTTLFKIASLIQSNQSLLTFSWHLLAEYYLKCQNSCNTDTDSLDLFANGHRRQTCIRNLRAAAS